MNNRIKNLVIIQARMGSTRLPGKVLKQIEGKTVLEHIINRLNACRYVDEVLVATSIEREDLAIVAECIKIGIRVFCGSEKDVLDRYYQVARLVKPHNIIRITADCPLHDVDVVDMVIKKHMEENNDYTSNTLKETFPDGLDVEIMKYEILKEAWEQANMASQREHVTQYIIHNEKYKKGSIICEKDYGEERWTLDTESDFRFISKVYSVLYEKNHLFGMRDILGLLELCPELKTINSNVERNEGLKKSILNDYIIEK